MCNISPSYFNNSLYSCTFAITKKYANTDQDKTDKKNDRPISILPNLNKLCKRFIYFLSTYFFSLLRLLYLSITAYNQIFSYFDKFFSKFQCGFQDLTFKFQYLNTQNYFLTVIENWCKNATNRRNVAK